MQKNLSLKRFPTTKHRRHILRVIGNVLFSKYS